MHSLIYGKYMEAYFKLLNSAWHKKIENLTHLLSSLSR